MDAIRTEALTKHYKVGFWRPRPYIALDGLSLQVGLLTVRAVLLAVHEHEIADHARLVAVRTRILEMDLRHHARPARVGHVQDRGAELRAVREVADVGVVALDADLSRPRQVEPPEPFHVFR